MIENEVLKVLRERRSIKQYRPEQVSDEALNAALEAAMYAPNGHGKQSPMIMVVQNKEVVQKLSQMNAAVMGVDSDPFYGAPTVAIIFGNPEVLTWMEDASLVAGNLLNAAHSVGLGGCWIHRARQMFESADGKEFMKMYGIPEFYKGVANCILGYPAGEPKPRQPRKEGFIYKIDNE